MDKKINYLLILFQFLLPGFREQITITQGQLATLTTGFNFFSKNATVFRNTSVVIIPNMSIIKSVFLKFKLNVDRKFSRLAVTMIM